MKTLGKLENAYANYLKVKGDKKELANFYIALHANSCVWNLFDSYRISVKENNNPILCMNMEYWYPEKTDEMLKALTYWGIDEFVSFDNSNKGLDELDFFCNNGWKLDGTYKVKYKNAADADGIYTGVKLVRA